MKNNHPNNTLAILVIALLLTLQPLLANPVRTFDPPLEVGETYLTMLDGGLFTFKILARRGPNWLKVEHITGPPINAGLHASLKRTEEIWINFSNLKFLAKIKTDQKAQAHEDDHRATREESNPGQRA